MAREYWSWINGQYANDSHISAFSGAVLHGYGAFETIYYGTGKIHYLSEHLERLQQAAEFYGLHYCLPDHEIETVITNLITKNQLREARIRLTLTAATSIYSNSHPNSDLQITVQPYLRKNSAVSLITAPASQFGCPLRGHKSTSYASYILAKQFAQKHNADDTLLHGAHRNYIECSTSNLFLAKEDRWITPDLTQYGLAGVQRQAVLNAMDTLRIPNSVEPIRELDFDSGFITNSLIGIQIIQRIDSKSFTTCQNPYIEQLKEIRALTS